MLSTVAELNRLGTQVRVDNVLQLRNALAAEVVRLQEGFLRTRRDMQVGECGGDPLSQPVADAFNRRIQALTHADDAYLAELNRVREELHRTALAYGHTEDDIARSFIAFQHTLPALYGQVRQERADRMGDAADMIFPAGRVQ